ncbi:MAG: GNAT family N-acetyltransferase [Chloroflexi bacterium]|nr:GNAT family N-acetyltransferase [Chloroflexota bacterium]MCC6892582.1 GNAT family N-acetyltransferase [Anaerolineae bacterium]
MHETIPARLPDRLKSAFGLDEPAGLRALGVVSGILPGRAWVDDLNQPTCALLTRADSRHQGYATLVCATLLQACEQQGCQTFWNCNSGNTPSLALARRLGYQRERQYQLTYWNQVDQ